MYNAETQTPHDSRVAPARRAWAATLGTVAIFTIRYDDAATTPDAVAAAVTDGVGYPARVLDE